MSLYLGIDLGTSNSVITGLVDNKIRIFRPVDGGETLPSMIYFDKRGYRLFGRRAHDQAFINPENVVAGFKRLMGTKTPLAVPEAGISLSPEECSAAIIQQLLGQMENEIGKQDITGAVVTIPAAFNQMQSEATLRAAELAGLENVALLQEPVAAALAAMAGTPREGYFMIYDLGGGTFDLALAHSKNGEVKIVAHQGINMLGGRDFDRLLVNDVVRPWLAKTFDLPEDFYRSPTYRKLIRIATLAAERAKIDLSLVEETQIFATEEEIRLQDQAARDIYLDVTLNRKTFEKLIEEPVHNTISLIRRVLEDANLTPADLDSVVFVGGPSRIPLIREMVSEALKVPVDLKLDPMTAVATGAAYHAEHLKWDKKPGAPRAEASRKPTEQRVDVDKKQTGLDMSFDYSARTASDKSQVRIQLRAKPAKARWLRALGSNDNWQSPLYKLEDGLALTLPLNQVGENRFTIAIFDEQRDPLPNGERPLSITRTAASAAAIPAAQTIAVKVLDRRGGENILDPLVEKGTPLPIDGKSAFQAARDLAAGSSDSLALELFQLEYPEKIELNLCIGVFFITGNDLPPGYVLRKGEPVTFSWAMDESGILRATVLLPGHEESNGQAIELTTPRFYSPQAAALAYDIKQGLPFARAMLGQAEQDWGDLISAIGPGAGADVQLLKDRLD
ncbi:MAG TPA: Hsp70 family protein, partial [Alphaproteobacteria bacterium]|nr:Hsp70 family protein [Alphaproteobacteria bacterium]